MRESGCIRSTLPAYGEYVCEKNIVSTDTFFYTYLSSLMLPLKIVKHFVIVSICYERIGIETDESALTQRYLWDRLDLDGS